MINTKEEVLLASLRLFAQEGYSDVSFAEIAHSQGVTSHALSRYIANKSEILRQCVSIIDDRYETNVPAPRISSETPSQRAEALSQFCLDLFAFWTGDVFAVAFRNALTLEQFRDKEQHQLFLHYFALAPLKILRNTFKELRIANADTRAVRVYSLIYFFYTLYDGAKEKEQIHLQFQQQITMLIKEITA